MDVASEILALFEAKGSLQYGEDVTQLEHALQCAAHARAECAPDSLVVAALLHDIGHLVTDEAEGAAEHGIDDRHEIVGDRYLAERFQASVCEPVRLHVEAKRYLCAVEPNYRQAFPQAPQLSLKLQGGPMSPAEILEFQRNPWYADAVRLRRWDDLGKDPELVVEPFVTYLPMIQRESLQT